MMCNVYGFFIVTGSVLLCCDLTRGYVLSENYLTDTGKTVQDLDTPTIPTLYQLLRRYPELPQGDEDKSEFEGLLNFSRRGTIRLSVDDTGGFDVSKRMTPPAREWCRLIGYKICRRSYSS